jgi:large conductance mechanosensitive channel
MFKGFKEFLFRGNILDLAIAVVIGGAFTALVTTVVTNILNPLIAAIGASPNKASGFTLVLNSSTAATTKATTVDFGAVITAVINFVIIAAVIYFVVVVPVSKIMNRTKKKEVAAPAEPTDVELLTEIRDLLRGQAK